MGFLGLGFVSMTLKVGCYEIAVVEEENKERFVNVPGPNLSAHLEIQTE